MYEWMMTILNIWTIIESRLHQVYVTLICLSFHNKKKVNNKITKPLVPKSPGLFGTKVLAGRPTEITNSKLFQDILDQFQDICISPTVYWNYHVPKSSGTSNSCGNVDKKNTKLDTNISDFDQRSHRNYCTVKLVYKGHQRKRIKVAIIYRRPL